MDTSERKSKQVSCLIGALFGGELRNDSKIIPKKNNFYKFYYVTARNRERVGDYHDGGGRALVRQEKCVVVVRSVLISSNNSCPPLSQLAHSLA